MKQRRPSLKPGGLFVALLGLIPLLAFLGLALWEYPIYVGVSLVVFIGLIGLQVRRVSRKRAQTEQLVDAAFLDIYAKLTPTPAIVMSSAYGYPTFTVEFRSRAELEAATAHNDAFKAQVATICKDYGAPRHPFRADMAVSFTYEGWYEDWRARRAAG